MPLDDSFREMAKSARSTFWNETVGLYFLTSRQQPDPDRENLKVQATVRAGNERSTNATGGGAQTWQTTIAAGEAEARIDRATYDGPPIRPGDKLEREERPGKPLYEVRFVNDRDASDHILALNES